MQFRRIIMKLVNGLPVRGHLHIGVHAVDHDVTRTTPAAIVSDCDLITGRDVSGFSGSHCKYKIGEHGLPHGLPP
jgi:hypothetical protein